MKGWQVIQLRAMEGDIVVDFDVKDKFGRAKGTIVRLATVDIAHGGTQNWVQAFSSYVGDMSSEGVRYQWQGIHTLDGIPSGFNRNPKLHLCVSEQSRAKQIQRYLKDAKWRANNPKKRKGEV